MTKKMFDIGGMHCGACATGIQMYLSNTDGIKNITVDYNKKIAEVEYDETKINDQKISETVAELGYTAKPQEIK